LSWEQKGGVKKASQPLADEGEAGGNGICVNETIWLDKPNILLAIEDVIQRPKFGGPNDRYMKKETMSSQCASERAQGSRGRKEPESLADREKAGRFRATNA